MRIVILFGNGDKFTSNDIENTQSLRCEIDAIINEIRQTNRPENVDLERQFAASGTAIKFPLHRQFKIALVNENGIFPVMDKKCRIYNFRGKSFLNVAANALLESKLLQALKGKEAILLPCVSSGDLLDEQLRIEQILKEEKKQQKLLAAKIEE